MAMRDVGVAAGKLRQERVLWSLTLAAFVLAAVTSGLLYFRWDLSSDRSLTLSRAARSLYEEIPETVFVTYYVSRSLSALHPGPRSALDLLREFEAHSRGRIVVKAWDPEADAARIESLGIYPRQLEVTEAGEARITTVYAGIVLEYLGDYRVLPSVLDADNLEYEMVKALRSLVRGSVPVAALLEGDGDKNPDGDYRILRAVLARAGYEVRIVPRGAAVDPDVSVLFLLGNAALDEYDAYFVDRYLSSGGRIFASARGVRVDPERGLAATPLPSNPLLELLAEYGVLVREELVLDVSCLTVPMQGEGAGGGEVYRYVRYPPWIVTDRANVSISHPAVAGYSGLDLFWPSPIELSERAGLSYAPLIRSTPLAWKQTRDFAVGPDDEALYREEEDATRGQYLLAVAVSGVFPSAFEGRRPPRRQGESTPLPEPVPADSRRPGRLLVAGSSDFLTDLMSLSRSEFNASFAVSAADWLSSEDDLPLSSRSSGPRRLRPAKDDSRRPTRIAWVYFINIFLVPASAGLYALFRSLRRKKAEREARGSKPQGQRASGERGAP